jgi:hypothetical protein
VGLQVQRAIQPPERWRALLAQEPGESSFAQPIRRNKIFAYLGPPDDENLGLEKEYASWRNYGAINRELTLLYAPGEILKTSDPSVVTIIYGASTTILYQRIELSTIVVQLKK